MRKILLITTVAAVSALGLSGCSGTNTTTVNVNSNANRMTNSTVAVNSNAMMNNSSGAMSNGSNSAMSNANGAMTMGGANDFMVKAAQGGMAEVELGKLASTKAQNAEVKKFGQMMMQDHSNANTELKVLAGKKNVTLPSDIGAMHKATMDELSKLSGAEFDKKYVEAMVKDHEKDVSEFQTQSEKATDADVKAFAAKTLPTLKKHLEMIKGIQSKMK